MTQKQIMEKLRKLSDRLLTVRCVNCLDGLTLHRVTENLGSYGIFYFAISDPRTRLEIIVRASRKKKNDKKGIAPGWINIATHIFVYEIRIKGQPESIHQMPHSKLVE